MNPFDYINAINDGRNIMRGTENDDLAEKGYKPYITNRSLSYFPDSILASNEMNSNGHLDSRLQYEFFINILRPQKRFAKWSKTEHHDDLEVVAQYFGYSYEKARVVMDILSSQEIKEIKRRLEKGGIKK